VILIKANVCKVLEPRLVKDGVRVLNHGIRPAVSDLPAGQVPHDFDMIFRSAAVL
jgi:hypothetical protein